MEKPTHRVRIFRSSDKPDPRYRGPAQPWRVTCTCFRFPDVAVRCQSWEQALRVTNGHLYPTLDDQLD